VRVCVCTGRISKPGLGWREGVSTFGSAGKGGEATRGSLLSGNPALFLKCQREQMVRLRFINHGLAELEGPRDHQVQAS
jgi:hypothetical protein